jgi:hypothetical protein
MSEQRTQSTQLFRTSLRSWQANYRARQAETSPPAEQAVATAAPTRVKKLTPYKKRRAMRQAAAARD